MGADNEKSKQTLESWGFSFENQTPLRLVADMLKTFHRLKADPARLGTVEWQAALATFEAVDGALSANAIMYYLQPDLGYPPGDWPLADCFEAGTTQLELLSQGINQLDHALTRLKMIQELLEKGDLPQTQSDETAIPTSPPTPSLPFSPFPPKLEPEPEPQTEE